jgi:hypothetical protein
VLFLVAGTVFVLLGVVGVFAVLAGLFRGRVDVCGLAFCAGLTAVEGLSIRHGYRAVRAHGSA